MRYAAIVVAALLAAPAHAHNGVNVSNAVFTNPVPPTVTPSDMGVELTPFTFQTADQSMTVMWQDGDNDPTGRFFFYYLDHAPTFQVLPADIETMASPVKATAADTVAGMNTPVAMWTGCTCSNDAGVVCPDAGAVRDCRNQFDWDTSQIAAGTYWLIAVNDDPPYHVYSIGLAPVRIAHGGASLPPAAMILRPDGFGSFDKSYRVQWYTAGKAPLKIDLAFGLDEEGSVFGPVTSLAKNLTPIMNSDGTQGYDWDVSGLETLKVYFLRVTVTDADGITSYTDSRFGLSVFHPGVDGGVFTTDGGSSRDGGNIVIPQPKSCSCDLGSRSGASTMIPFALLILTFFVVSRSRRRS